MKSSRTALSFLFAVALAAMATACVSDPADEAELEALEKRVPGDVVSRWNQRGFAVIGTDPRTQIRGMTMMHIAMHDAANAVRSKYARYALGAVDGEGADPAGAAAVAAHDVLVALRPASKAQLDSWLAEDLAAVKHEQHRQRSREVGAAAAQAILELRAMDNCCSDTPYTPGTEPGDYQFTPPFDGFRFTYGTGWPNMLPFSLDSGDQFLPPGPPALSSAEWAAEYNETKDYGRNTSTVRSAEQTFLARFWLDGTAQIYSRIAINLIGEEEADLWESARALALAFIAGNDAAIAVWDAKYHYEFWRPFTAIRRGDTDGNDATAPDTTWSPLALTPPHPEYDSAHAATAAAAAVALGEAFGDDVPVHATSATAAGEVSWSNLAESAAQCAESRVWVGYHFRSAIEDGLSQGDAVGQWVVDNTGLDRL